MVLSGGRTSLKRGPRAAYILQSTGNTSDAPRFRNEDDPEYFEYSYVVLYSVRPSRRISGSTQLIRLSKEADRDKSIDAVPHAMARIPSVRPKPSTYRVDFWIGGLYVGSVPDMIVRLP